MKKEKIFRISLFFFMFLSIWLLSLFCASSAPPKKIVNFPGIDRRLLYEADSLFYLGNYEFAKIKYSKLRDTSRDSFVVDEAQYKLGYINIYYKNPFEDYEAALREFKHYLKIFPNGKHTNEVKSWIRMLVALQGFERDFTGTSKLSKSNEAKLKRLFKNYTNLQDKNLECESHIDSLSNRIKFLEGVIEGLQRIE